MKRLALPALCAVALCFWLAPRLFSPTTNTTPSLSAANSISPANLVSSVSEIDFGTVTLGEYDSKRLVLTNTALDDTAITVSATWLSEPDALVFSSDFKGPQTVLAGDSLVIELEFRPRDAGHVSGALFVSHDGESTLDIYELNGNGVSADSSLPSLGQAKPVTEPAFGKSQLAGFSGIKPTSLQFGPDGRLYVADMLGLVKVLDIQRDGANDYRVVSEETIKLIRDIPNHDDDGTPNQAIDKRLVTGLLVTGTASNPIIYIASSDPRIGGGPSHTETGLDTNSGVISRLTRNAAGDWQRLDLVRGLPRSEENHHVNGLVLDESTQRLYVGAGGNTNQGAPSNNFAKLPEYALSAAILEIDLAAIGESTYDLPTLDDQTRQGKKDAGDPFGGNDGLNQAMLVPGGPVTVYAPGFRNPYDLVLTEDGRLYSIDNGPNAGWGGPPKGKAAQGLCTNAQSEPGKTQHDSLHLISGPGYYGGHPNPTRANPQNTFNPKNPQSPVSVANPIECDFQAAGGDQALTTFKFSTNGLVEYRATNFSGAMQGDLLAAAWNNSLQRITLTPDGSKLKGKQVLFSNVGGLPLDVTAQDDFSHYPGTIWVADFVDKQIVVFEPVDYDGQQPGLCGDTLSDDDDKDGFSNDDELLNGTDPCSAADLPSDLDGDFLSDRFDTDDDNDGIADTADPFPMDPDNGRGTGLPVHHEWENDSEAAGFLFNLGFSGLMNNGKDDYLDLFSLDNMTAGGAAGVLTIDAIPNGDPVRDKNSQAYGFQFGIDATPATPAFTVHTRLLAPFEGTTPGGHQSMGLFIGTGDQDNYIKLVINSRFGTGSVQFAAEHKGVFQQVANPLAPIIGSDAVDLFLRVDPATGSVAAFYQIGEDSSRIAIGEITALPSAWLTADTGLAAGIISTSIGGSPFSATWDFVRVTADQATDDSGPASDETDSPDTAADANGLIIIDAEHPLENTGASDREWVAGARPGARGNGSLIASPDGGTISLTEKGAPHLRYSVDFPAAGQWRVWVRGWGDAINGEGKSDSVHVGIDGKLLAAKAIQGFPAGEWTWSNTVRGGGIATLTVSTPGQHVVDVWMREDGFEIDALLLTLDADYTPAGLGPDGDQASDDGSGNGQDDGGTSDDGANDADPAGSGGTTSSGGTGDSGDSGDAGDAGNQGDAGNGDDSSGPDAGSSTGNDGNDDTGSQATTGGSADSGDGAAPTDDDGGDGDQTLDDDLILIQAERFNTIQASKSHDWTSGSRPGARGGSMTSTPNNGTLKSGSAGSPMLSYEVDFPTAGNWHVWVRGWGDAVDGEGKNDSVHVGIDGKLAGGTAIQGFPAGGWTWSQTLRGGGVATIAVDKPGKHDVHVWMREDGFEFDALLLTADANYRPSGTGPVADTSSDGNGNADASDAGDTGSAGGTHDTQGDDPSNEDSTADDTSGNTDSGSDTAADDDASGHPDDASDGQAGHDSADRIVIQAVKPQSMQAGGIHTWTEGTSPGASSGSMVTVPNNGTLKQGSAGSPRLRYSVNFPSAGTWYVWVHGLGDAINGEGKNDSVHVGIDGKLSDAVAIQGFPKGDWTWSNQRRDGNRASLTVGSPGPHAVDVWMREDGFEFDTLLLTLDADQVPAGEYEGSDNASTNGEPGKSGGDGGDTSSGSDAPRLSASRDWVIRSASAGSVTPRHEAGAVELDGKLYLLGGRGDRPIDIYNPVTKTWTQGAPSPMEMHHFQPIAHDGRIWIVGAMTCCYPREQNVDHVWTYSPATNRWARGVEIPQTRRRGSAGTVLRQGRIYLVGGNTRGHDGGAVAWMDEFDPATGSWRILPDAPEERDHAQASLVGHTLVLAGGRRSSQPDVFENTIAEVDLFDFSTGQWRQGTSIPTQRAGSMSIAVADEVLIVGGESNSRSSAHDTVEAYDVDADAWRSLRPLRTGRHGGGLVRLADGLHVVSGATTRGGSKETGSHERLALD